MSYFSLARNFLKLIDKKIVPFNDKINWWKVNKTFVTHYTFPNSRWQSKMTSFILIEIMLTRYLNKYGWSLIFLNYQIYSTVQSLIHFFIFFFLLIKWISLIYISFSLIDLFRIRKGPLINDITQKTGFLKLIFSIVTTCSIGKLENFRTPSPFL